MKQGSSGLTIRECQITHRPAFELTPKKVSQWVKDLPIANLGDTSKNVYRLLVDVNQTVIDADKRFSIINTIEPVIDELTIALEKQFIRNHIALNDKQKKIAALLQAIQTELAIGYHAIVESIVSEEVKRSQKNILASSVSMAIKYHGFIILRCFQLYTSVPSRVWREIYCLYQIATKNELENHPVGLEANKRPITAHNYFIQILLLSVANPYQLRQHDIQLLWDILPELSEHATLMSHAFNKHHFVVSLETGAPPIHKSLYDTQQNNSTKLKLTVFTALEHLKNMLVNVADTGQQNLRKSMLLRHLVQCWSHGTNRTFARTPNCETLDISIGLGATHYLLMQNDDDDSEDDNKTLNQFSGSLENATLQEITTSVRHKSESNKNYLSSSKTVDDDAWAKLYRPTQVMKSALQEIETNNRSLDSIVKNSYRLQEVALLNMSPGGYCIQIAAEDLPKHAQTGEIIGILEYDHKDREHWSVAVVKWVRRQLKENVVQMGVQLLAPGAIPVDVKLLNRNVDPKDFHRVLILPALTGVGQPATLLTNPLSFSVNNKVQIVDHGLSYEARLTKEVAFSSSFKQFEYEKVSEGKRDAKNERVKKEHPFGSVELDDIWNLI